jgi:hypothetical protein
LLYSRHVGISFTQRRLRFPSWPRRNTPGSRDQDYLGKAGSDASLIDVAFNDQDLAAIVKASMGRDGTEYLGTSVSKEMTR